MTLDYAIIKKVKDWAPYVAGATTNKAHAIKFAAELERENPFCKTDIVPIKPNIKVFPWDGAP